MSKLKLSRKAFVKSMLTIAGSFFLFERSILRGFAKDKKTLKPRIKKYRAVACDLAVVKGENPGKITEKAIELLGGIEKFVSRGDTVVVKPNIGWNKSPEYAANTNPIVVATIVKMCYDAGAKVVKVFDNTCNNSRMCYENSGIYKSVKSSGGYIYYTSDWKFYPGEFPKNSLMNEWPIFKDAVECDCFINVPIAKHHGLTGLTLSMKNLMGVCGGSRGKMHWDIDRKLAELTDFIKPDLTVIDAYRILLRHGPQGGNLKDVEKKKTVIASADPVLADSYAATLFNISPEKIGYIKKGAEFKLGSMDIKNANTKKIVI